MMKSSARHRIEDVDRKKHAIASAFRVAALSTQGKSLPHLAQHYQDLMHLPAGIDDPEVYYNTLEQARINHNRSKGIANPEVAHQPHLKSLHEYYAWFYAHHPHMSPSEAREAANREVHIYQYEIEDKMAREKPDKPIEERDVFKELDRKLKNFVKPHKEGAETIHPGLDHPDAYPGFHQHSCFGMAQASRHLDDLLQYAREDIAQGGRGHHFRDKVLDHNIKHIGPKEASLAWHLLSPNKSELAHIDHAILDALGYKPKDYNARDYALYERQLIAARDAAGYNHMPLSHFQKGLMDAYQGPVSHETLAVHDPVRFSQADWTLKPAPHIWPDWWDQTKPYREKVKRDWDKNEGRYNPPQTVMAQTRYNSNGNSRLATIGPNVDNEINDPLANNSTDPMPSWEWQQQEPCKVCHGEGLVMLNGKTTACPSCSGWEEKKMFDDDPGVPDPSYGENPTGVHELAPGTTGP